MALKIKDFGTHTQNPFKAEGIVAKKGYLKTETTPVAVIESGEIMDLQSSKLKAAYLVDKAPYTKVYTGAWETLRDFSTPAYKLFAYINQFALKPNKDVITLYRPDVIAKLGYSAPPMYYRGLVELLEKEILSRVRGADDDFFINVNVFFNGDRTRCESGRESLNEMLDQLND